MTAGGLEDRWVSEFQGNLLLLLALARGESLGKEGSLCCNGEEDQSTAALLAGASGGTTVRWEGIGKFGYDTWESENLLAIGGSSASRSRLASSSKSFSSK